VVINRIHFDGKGGFGYCRLSRLFFELCFELKAGLKVIAMPEGYKQEEQA